MPYIKKIKIKGFKSFGSKIVTINLDKGFTVLTGPNGSGKSNIIDAILFGLGELSARKLRSENLGKLVFNGGVQSGTSKPKYAKVDVQFDNSDRRIPINTNVVTISREVDWNGQCIYQFNGRKTTRSHIVDMLSVAGIGPSGHNVVMQGTISRMAEISPYERRKTIEDLIGIAQYDAEKAEAEEKLQKAEISLRTAWGRIGEVQKRVNDLERERNELLRYNFIQNEIKRLKAINISYDILEIEKKAKDYSCKSEKLHGKVEKLKQLRDELRSKRHKIEGEWRKFNSEILEEGSTRVLEVQIKIGDLKSKLAEVTTKIDVGSANVKELKKVKENNLKQLEAIKNEITETRIKIRQLKKELVHLSKKISIEKTRHNVVSQEVAQTRSNIEEKSEKGRNIEKELDKHHKSFVALRIKDVHNKAKLKAISQKLNDLTPRKNRFESTLNELEKSLVDLTEVKNEQEERLKNHKQTIDKRIAQKQTIETEFAEAGRVADTAREAIMEFSTQRKLAEKVATEEMALKKIEELGNIGAIQGVYGRLRNLIKIKSGYKKAIEAAASGWLDSIIVKDIDVALICAETLKRLKLGRIKIIPLQETFNIMPITNPKIEGIIGITSEFVKSTKRYEAAVTFIFGDTFTAVDEKTALVASGKGHRTVTVKGDLFEAGGGMESGYYRDPIYFSSIVPSEPSIKSLDQAVKALKGHLIEKEAAITVLQEEVNKGRVEITQLVEATSTLSNEIMRVERNIDRTKNNIKQILKSTKRLQNQYEKENAEYGIYRKQRSNIQREMRNLRKKLTALKQETASIKKIQEMETERERLRDKIIEMQQKYGVIETEYSTLNSKLKNVLQLSLRNIENQLRRVERQLSVFEKEIVDTFQQKGNLEKELHKLEELQEELSHSVLKAKEEANGFTQQINDIDKQVYALDSEYEKANRLFNQLQLSLQTCQLQLERHNHQLRDLGYEKPFVVLSEQILSSNSSLNLMQLELDRLGAVNQLALSQYAEQISRYKELSIHINELEQEKQAILKFMDEIEEKKRNAFMSAFNQINESLSIYFSKLTGGGEAALKLGNVKDLFSGGIDMVVQFPTKPPILVSGASGGERSVATVAFILALQDITPAAFYLFDEVDAHLDAFHVEKLGELLSEDTSKSQFLVISLKPEFVSKAERVLGIYARNGVTQVVSTTFAQIINSAT